MNLMKSRELYERARKSLAGGVSSNGRAAELPTPLFIDRAQGSHIYDVDGNEYIDYLMGYGPNIFGHSPSFLLEAVTFGMRKGQTLGGQHEMEIKVSEAIQEIVPSAELVRYASSGTEVDQVALRLARAYSGKSKFIKFEGHYHGWSDGVVFSTTHSVEVAGPYESPFSVPMSVGLAPGVSEDVIVLPWNDIDVLRVAIDRHQDELAAVITEPIMCNTNCIVPRPGYLEGMRDLCDERGIILIFDEVITGFRFAAGGAQELLGVIPDISTFSKSMAGGFPIAMVAGRRGIMGLMEEGTVLHGGTFNSNVMSMAATNASLEKIKENHGEVYRQLYSKGAMLMEGLRALGQRHELELLVQGPGPAFCVAFTSESEITDHRSHDANVDTARYARFCKAMLERGVRLPGRGIWFVSIAHTDEDIERTLAAANEALASV